jgi:hypothetical protein
VFEAKCDSVEEFDYDENFKYYKYSNFKNHKATENAQYFPGKYFVITSDGKLWHSLSEQFAQYDLLLKKIPDLKLFFMNITPEVQEPILTIEEFSKLALERCVFKNLAFFKDLVSAYTNTYSLIYSADNSDFMLEECYFICDTRMLINPKEYSKYLFKPYWSKKEGHQPWVGRENSIENPDARWSLYGMRLTRERLLNLVKENPSSPKKIYIDRSTDTNRTFSQENLIKDLFVSLGYTPIILTEFDYLQQLNYFYNADVIAGLCGTGILNSFICKPDTTVIEIFVEANSEKDTSMTRFGIGFSYLQDIAPINLKSIDLRFLGRTAVINTRTLNILKEVALYE